MTNCAGIMALRLALDVAATVAGVLLVVFFMVSMNEWERKNENE